MTFFEIHSLKKIIMEGHQLLVSSSLQTQKVVELSAAWEEVEEDTDKSFPTWVESQERQH